MAKEKFPGKHRSVQNDEERQLQAVAEFQARQRKAATSDAVDAKVIDLPKPTEPAVAEQVSPEVKKLETEEQEIIERKVDERIAAEQASAAAVKTVESKPIPPELKEIYGDNVPTDKLRMYEKLTDPRTKQSVIDQLAADEAKRKRKEERQKAADGTEKEKRTPTFSEQERRAIIQETVNQLEAEVKPLQESGEPMPTEEKIQAPEVVPFDGIKEVLEAQLKGKAEIIGLDFTETPDGLQLHAELHHGMAGKILVDGTVVNQGNSIGVEGLEVKADSWKGRAKKEIENRLAGIGAILKTQLESKYGKPIADIQVGESGLTVAFEPSPSEPEQPQEAVFSGEQREVVEGFDYPNVYTQLSAMYDRKVPDEVYKESESLQDEVQNSSLGSDERRTADEKLHAFMLEQWAATEANRPKGHPINYATWANRLNLFEDQHTTRYWKLISLYPKSESTPPEVYNRYERFKEEYIKALNVGDEKKMAEVSAEADTFIAEQHARVGEEVGPDDRKEPTLGNATEPLEDISPTPDGTQDWRNAWFSRLRETVGKVIEGTKEKVEWWKSAEAGLIRRSQELDAQAEKIGGLEKKFRSWGEKYNKMPLKYKLALGASLGLGAVVTSGSLVMAIPLLGIAGQRVLGLSTMYLKYEKKSHDEAWGKNKEWGKQKALLKAGAYTVLVGLTMKEAIELASETELAHAAQAKIQEWLGNMFGHHPAETPVAARAPTAALTAAVAPAPEAPTTLAAPEAPAAPVPTPEAAVPPAAEVPQPAAAAAAGEAVTPAPEAFELGELITEPPGTTPEISVDAVKGKGYEYMMKRMWEQLQEKGLDASQYPEGSDIRKLIETDADSIDKVVHQLAADERHGFFRPDGTSVRIAPDAQMTFGARGELHLSDAERDLTWAPKHLPATPAFHPEASAAEAVSPPIEDSAARAELENFAPTQPGHQVPEDEPLPRVDMKEPEPIQPIEAPEHTPTTSVDSAVVTNRFGLEIPTNEAHIYAGPGAEHLYVYGGSPEQRMGAIVKFLDENPGKVVYAADANGAYRIPYGLLNETVTVVGPPEQTEGFIGLFKRLIEEPPGPDDLQKIIK